jgi:DNA repair photolyase
MKANIPLPTLSPRKRALQLQRSAAPSGLGLPRVEKRARKGAALHASPVGGEDVLSLNIMAGCVHRCGFCPARAYATNPGDGVVQLFTNNVERIHEELQTRRQKPRAVYVSPATDPFPPVAEIQAETGRVVEALAAHGVSAWLMTRGYIRPSALHVLDTHREHVKVTIGLTTLNRELQRILEPLTAPPKMRVRQIAQLRELGIETKVSIEPLVPGLTDTRENLEPLLEALAAVGIRQVTAGYMFLRQGIRENLVQALEPHGWDGMVMAAFHGGPVLESGNIAPARYLPKARRQRGYSTLMALAANLGITVSVSGLTNPDFRPARVPAPEMSARQMMLPMF